MYTRTIYHQLKYKQILSICQHRNLTYSKIEHLVDFCNLAKTTLDYTLGLSNNRDYIYKPINTNKKTIGNKLREVRKNNKLTQNELANELCTVHSVISSYENGKTLILTAFLYEICKKYNVSADWIFS